jgi:uncharacterized tellurite resistance protein B-like protein
MIWLSNSTLSRLRDQLQARGQKPSVVVPEPGTSLDEAELAALTAEYGPLCEAMFLMMTADRKVTESERSVLKGALRNLSSDSIRTAHMEAMLESARQNVAEQGREARMKEVAAQLREDSARAEVAFVLAAAIAFADNAIADEENDALNDLADGLGIDEDRANHLLDEVEADFNAGPKPADVPPS